MISKNSAVTIHNTEAFTFHSSIVEDTFSIQVALPKSYKVTQKAYPVLYVLDANVFYGITLGAARLLQFGNEIPELIVIGIGYPNEDEHMVLRNRDYLPTYNDGSEQSGQAEAFLKFMAEELIPQINKKYRVEAENVTLAGDSYSGLFALYALFTKPGVFNKYIIGSPSIYWDKRVIFDYEKKYAQNNDNLKAKVFLSVGQLEATLEPAFARMVGNVVDMWEQLEKRKYSDLELVTHVFENETHLSVIPATMSRGLREVYK